MREDQQNLKTISGTDRTPMQRLQSGTFPHHTGTRDAFPWNAIRGSRTIINPGGNENPGVPALPREGNGPVLKMFFKWAQTLLIVFSTGDSKSDSLAAQTAHLFIYLFFEGHEGMYGMFRGG